MAVTARTVTNIPTPGVAARITGLDWPTLSRELDEFGCARTGPLLSPAECTTLVGQYRIGPVVS